jgi:hypothetical protein
MANNIDAAQGIQGGLQTQLPVQEQYPNKWTCVKTERLALYIFAALALIGAVAVLGLGIASVIATPYAWLAVPLAILGVGAICWARSLNDYQNPKELHEMRLEAHHMTFRDLYKKHGPSNFGRYIAAEEGPSMNDLKNRFNMSEGNFEDILDTYNIQDLEANGFIRSKQLTELSELMAAKDQIQANYGHTCHQIDLKYSGRTDKLHQHVNAAHLAANGLAYGFTDDRGMQRNVGAVAGVLAIAGHVGAELAGRDQQISHDQELAQALGVKRQRLYVLQVRYTNFRANLLENLV